LKPKIRSLLVHDREDRLLMLKSALHGLGVETTRARTCHLAGPILCDTPPPHLVFTDVVLPDGNWMDVLDLAAKAKERVNLIVVSPRADIGLYIDVMNHGAFDFITESFTVTEIVYVVKTGIENAVNARQRAQGAPRRPEGRLSLEESKLGTEGADRAQAWPG
jgi:DNA-binding NtrC family response regulator